MGEPRAAKQVLVVEDEGELRAELCDWLVFEGYHAIGCRDGNRAWTLLSCGLRPDVLVTDLALPNMSGRELVCRIREEDWGRRIPILLLSAWESAHRFALPVDAILPKGAEPESLARAVDRLARWGTRPLPDAPAARRPPQRAVSARPDAAERRAGR